MESSNYGYYQCKSCLIKTELEFEHQQLFDLISAYILRYYTHDVDINVMHLIANYAKGIMVMCPNIHNPMNPCMNMKFYPTKPQFQQDYGFSSLKNFATNLTYRESSCAIQSFKDMGLHKDLLRGIYEYGCIPTTTSPEIQQFINMPTTWSKHDIIVQSNSVEAKDCVFSIASLQRVDITNSQCQILILSPTTKLAKQTYQIITKLGNYISGINIDLCTDGFRPNARIIVGTISKVAKLLSTGNLHLKSLELCILNGVKGTTSFKNEMYDICQHLPVNVQRAVVSTKMPDKVLKFTEMFMRETAYLLFAFL